MPPSAWLFANVQLLIVPLFEKKQSAPPTPAVASLPGERVGCREPCGMEPSDLNRATTGR